jgi:hypothetical protein
LTPKAEVNSSSNRWTRRKLQFHHRDDVVDLCEVVGGAFHQQSALQRAEDMRRDITPLSSRSRNDSAVVAQNHAQRE